MESYTYTTNNGIKIWYMYDKYNARCIHREDGPAIIYEHGLELWHYFHKEYETPYEMPLNLFLAYCKWEYKKNES